jgi:hypothetical protein
MTMIARYDLVDETVTFPAPLPPQQAWRSAIATLATRARKALPDSTGRIDLAVQLILNGDVELLPDGRARIGSQSDPTKTYTLNGRACPCPDAGKAPSGLCKHRLAKGLYARALDLTKALVERGTTVSTAAEVPTEAPAPVPASGAASEPTPEPPAPPVSIPSQFLVEIQGKQFVTFHGLLALAHQQGLTSLKALQPGNTLVVWKLDRLGRDLKHLVSVVDVLGKGCRTGLLRVAQGPDDTAADHRGQIDFVGETAALLFIRQKIAR